jgi:hypothetical protein
MFDSVNASLTIIKANTKQYKQHKSRPLLIITRDIEIILKRIEWVLRGKSRDKSRCPDVLMYILIPGCKAAMFRRSGKLRR